MSGDAFKKTQAGQKLDISAKAYNAFVDAALANQTRSNVGASAGAGRQHLGNVLIQNKTGSDLAEFAVVGLGDPIFEPTDAAKTATFKAQVGFEGDTPATASHTGKFAILLEPIADDNIGIARVSGLCPVKIDITDTDHAFADIDNSETGNLNSATSGAAQILWAESGTGVKWAVVRLGAPVQSSSMFAVLVWRDGGTTDGSKTTQCNRTYKVRTRDATGPDTGGELLGTGMTPEKTRPYPYGPLVVPSSTGSGVAGFGYHDSNNDFQLFEANETLNTAAC